MESLRKFGSLANRISACIGRVWSAAEDIVRVAIAVVLFPFQALAFVCRAAEIAGRAILVGSMRLLVGLFGLAFIGWIGFALVRVVFHPLF
jgi:hypothetical protein